jgi:6-phosphogluconate dehydrogenase
MGANLALNVESRGFSTAVYNRTWATTEKFLHTEGRGKGVHGYRTPQEFVASLDRPRRVLLMVKAGQPTDDMINLFLPLLEPGDILIDGGNSHYRDTERRFEQVTHAGVHFVGMGVSGGEEGARFGPSLMPGGTEAAYAALQPILEKIAAQTDSGACVTYVGRGSAGHFVKMVHNGIEYGDMQLIAESYDLLRHLGGLTAVQLEDTFGTWNRGRMSSFLIEITADIVNRHDKDTGAVMLDVILDKAGQKGTGKWTTQAALDLGVPIPTITAAVDARILSSMKDERTKAETILGPAHPAPAADAKGLVADVEAALYAAKVISYAQGLAMLSAASREFNYGLKLEEIARIWKGGCIIRATLLDRIMGALRANPTLPNLLLDPGFAKEIREALPAWRRVVSLAVANGIAVPAMSASLAYYDTYRRGRGPAYLIQAQRDYFGAHTFERTDREGSFHLEWTRSV